jgi:drug/metabolite transporter (DMT)-like permease
MALRNLALLVALAFLWGSSNIFIKMSVETIPPMTVSACRITTALVAYAGFALWQGAVWPRSWAAWRALAALALLGYILPPFLIAYGQKRIDSGIASIIIGSIPILTALLSHLVTREERLGPRAITGVTLGFVGVAVLTGPGAFAGIGGPLEGYLAVFAGAVSYAILNVVARHVRELSPSVIGPTVLFLSAVVLTPAAAVVDFPTITEPSLRSILAVLALGLLSTGIGLGAYFHLVARTGPTYVAMVNYLTPVVGVFLAVLVLGERLPLTAFVALALILAGIGVTTTAKTKPRT